MVTRIEALTDAQRAAMPEWADRWIEIGLRTGEADWEKFESAAEACYRFAGLEWPGVVVRVPNPLVGALAAPIAGQILDSVAVGGAVAGSVAEAVRGAVAGAVAGAVRGAVEEAVAVAVGGAVRGAVEGAVAEAVRGSVAGSVRGAVDGAVDGAVNGAVAGAVREAVNGAVDRAVHDGWWRYCGGQFWAGWWWAGAPSAFLREVCELELPGDLWDRARAWEATIESACWWWPHTQFVMVCDRPNEIHLEQVAPRGWGSHRLHREDGPAISWDGWAIWTWHGIQVTEQIVRGQFTAQDWLNEPNAEIRRVMGEVKGAAWLLDQLRAEKRHADEWGTLWRIPDPDGDANGDIQIVEVVNSTPEPDGAFRRFHLFVPPDMDRARQAIAWTFDLPEDAYLPEVMT